MAKQIDKIIQSKTAPKSNNVLWDDGENLKINRNGKWEGVTKQNTTNEELYAYPMEIGDKEFKVVELGGEKLYNYIGEISIPSDMEEVEGTIPCDILETEYYYQPIYEGVLQEAFDYEMDDRHVNLYIGNDKYGYTSLKIEPSEDPNNLKWFYTISLGMFQEGPGSISFAYDAKNWTLHYKANSYVPCNIKVYWLYRAQKLDINLIPQEIARKEDIATEINNYEYPVVTVDADNLTYEGELRSNTIILDINILDDHYERNNLLKKQGEDSRSVQYRNNSIVADFSKSEKRINYIDLIKPIFTSDALDYWDYKNCGIPIVGLCNVVYEDNIYPATIDYNGFVTSLIDGKYLKYKLNRETHLLELQSELDLNSIESRLAALEAK